MLTVKRTVKAIGRENSLTSSTASILKVFKNLSPDLLI
jgi:hypothetical protein